MGNCKNPASGGTAEGDSAITTHPPFRNSIVADAKNTAYSPAADTPYECAVRPFMPTIAMHPLPRTISEDKSFAYKANYHQQQMIVQPAIAVGMKHTLRGLTF
jgi:hypothetical protein